MSHLLHDDRPMRFPVGQIITEILKLIGHLMPWYAEFRLRADKRPLFPRGSGHRVKDSVADGCEGELLRGVDEGGVAVRVDAHATQSFDPADGSFDGPAGAPRCELGDRLRCRCLELTMPPEWPGCRIPRQRRVGLASERSVPAGHRSRDTQPRWAGFLDDH